MKRGKTPKMENYFSNFKIPKYKIWRNLKRLLSKQDFWVLLIELIWMFVNRSETSGSIIISQSYIDLYFDGIFPISEFFPFWEFFPSLKRNAIEDCWFELQSIEMRSEQKTFVCTSLANRTIYYWDLFLLW